MYEHEHVCVVCGAECNPCWEMCDDCERLPQELGLDELAAYRAALDEYDRLGYLKCCRPSYAA